MKKEKGRAKGAGGFVYVIENPAWAGFVKIGKADAVDRRLSVYQTGDPLRQYRVVFAKATSNPGADEARVHKVLAEFRVDGTEWFKVTGATATEVVNLVCA